ncbi:MAG: DNA-processing protein DprA [Thermoanaerobacteraceae bacterium]|nr:DNA-processing protein DprA [Thermoanaerobacteraceae bacterium]
MDNNKVFAIWLSSINGIGSKTFNKLVDYFGSPEAVYKADNKELIKYLGNGVTYKNIVEAKKQNPFKNIDILIKNKIEVLLITDEDYPELLRNIYNPPPILYIRGKLKKCDEISIAVVGSRNATAYGKFIAEKISYDIAKHGMTVISGMARGIDSYSHKGAMKAQGRTIAVLGCGVNITYPKENEKLMNEIIENGAVISEFPIDYLPVSGNFPARNRIISGLSLGVLVVEASVKSGSLITAKFALDQGRDVFAVPGNITSAYSKGTNELIKQGAKLVNDVNDILEEFDLRTDIKERINEQMINTLNNDEKKVYEFICDCTRDIDEIINYMNYSVSKINCILTSLTVKGFINRVPGNKYEKNFEKF